MQLNSTVKQILIWVFMIACLICLWQFVVKGAGVGQDPVRREADPLDTLTPRERDVLALMAEGRSNRAIGERLFLSPKTVEAHVSAIFSKLGIESAGDDNRRVLSVLTWLRSAGRDTADARDDAGQD